MDEEFTFNESEPTQQYYQEGEEVVKMEEEEDIQLIVVGEVELMH